MVIPLKLLPWLLLIGGIILLVDGDPAGTFSFLLGLVWLILKYAFKAKKSSTSNSYTSSNTTSSPYTGTTGTNPISTTNTATAGSGASLNVCPNCRAAMDSSLSFCTKCGTKLK